MVRSSSPLRIRRKRAFPRPEGPTMQINEPSSRVREKSSSAQTGSAPAKNTLETSFATTADDRSVVIAGSFESRARGAQAGSGLTHRTAVRPPPRTRSHFLDSDEKIGRAHV